MLVIVNCHIIIQNITWKLLKDLINKYYIKPTIDNDLKNELIKRTDNKYSNKPTIEKPIQRSSIYMMRPYLFTIETILWY